MRRSKKDKGGIRIDYDDEGLIPPDGYTGVWEYYWPNRQLKYRANYVNGETHGEVTCWWDNGGLSQVGWSEHGICKGIWTDYLEDGTKTLETEYVDNDTFTTRGYMEGKVDNVCEYQGGVPTLEIEYNGDDTIVRRYSKDGSVQQFEEWRNGTKITETEYLGEGHRVVRCYADGKVVEVKDLGADP